MFPQHKYAPLMPSVFLPIITEYEKESTVLPLPLVSSPRPSNSSIALSESHISEQPSLTNSSTSLPSSMTSSLNLSLPLLITKVLLRRSNRTHTKPSWLQDFIYTIQSSSSQPFKFNSFHLSFLANMASS